MGESVKHRTTDPAKLAEHDEAWRALKALPLDAEIETLFARLSDLQTWNPSCATLAEHTARYEAGQPHAIWARIKTLQAELYKTPENLRWFAAYQSLYA